MRLLSLTVSNHRSFRDEFTLDLVNPALRTNLPPKGKTWADYVYPVAIILGANGAGKTAVLDALGYIRAALLTSAGAWLDLKVMPRDPFRLEKSSRKSASRYSVDFVMDVDWRADSVGERRFVYDFEVDAEGVSREELLEFRSSRPSTLFLRRRGEVTKATVKVPAVADAELILSRALKVRDPELGRLANSLVKDLSVYSVGEGQRIAVLRSIIDSLAEGGVDFEELEDLARVADIGIYRAELDEKELSGPELEAVRQGLLNSNVKHPAFPGKVDDEALEKVKVIERSLRFAHSNSEDPEALLDLNDESEGTKAWVAIAFHLVSALRTGAVAIVDEIDTSIHSALLIEIMRYFQDPVLNRHGAQLICTTHDQTILENDTELDLKPEQVWFAEKRGDGASELFSAGDFPLKPGSNIAKQYREGRLGAVPMLAPSILRALIEK